MRRVQCRLCGSEQLRLVHDFGLQPLAGEFPLAPASVQPPVRSPLDLTQCDVCALLQVTNLPPISEVFHDDYRYSSSTVPSLVRHFDEYAEWLSARLPGGAAILEFGCNDGVLLSKLAKRGFDCVGVDASANVAALARSKGLDIRTAFLVTSLVEAETLEDRFDLVTCSNVLAHIDDVAETLRAVHSALKRDGMFSIEVHDAAALVQEAQFETIYHEHLTYFSDLTLRRLVERNGFAVVECSTTPMHGGALRLLCRRWDGRQPRSLAPTMSPRERIGGSAFAAMIDRCASDVRGAVRDYGLLDAYGAAGRSQMFINMTRTEDCFGQVFDDSPFRQNRYIVGTDIPIRSYSEKRGRACVILAWNYADAIAERIRGHFEQVLTVLPRRTCW